MFTFGVNSMNAQYQSLFGSNNASWNIVKGNLWGSGTDSLYTVSDTVINGKTYKKIAYQDITETPSFPLVGFLREDSTQGKAWFFNSADTTEYLIMDLSLNWGDTFYMGGSWNSIPGYFPVDSIWTSLGRKHVRVDHYIPWFNNGVSDKLIFIEGVSTNIGIAYQTFDIMNFPFLLCSHKDGLPIYQNDDSVLNGACVYTTVGINEELNVSNIKLYPNPSSNHLMIENLGQQKSKVVIELRTIDGKIAITQKASSFEKIMVNTTELPAGIYFVMVKDAEQTLTTQKWVKME